MKYRFSLEYLAGFFDGEGSICIARGTTEGEKVKRGKPGANYEKYWLIISVVNTNRDVLEGFVERFGGAIHSKKPVPNRHQCFVWTIRRKETVLHFLSEMDDMLFVKQEQARLAFEFIALNRSWNTQRRKEIYEAMHGMNGRRNYQRRREVSPASLVRRHHRKLTITDDGVGLE